MKFSLNQREIIVTGFYFYVKSLFKEFFYGLSLLKTITCWKSLCILSPFGSVI